MEARYFGNVVHVTSAGGLVVERLDGLGWVYVPSREALADAASARGSSYRSGQAARGAKSTFWSRFAGRPAHPSRCGRNGGGSARRVRSFLRHPGLAQTDKISGFV
jgi:hypothetical protein